MAERPARAKPAGEAPRLARPTIRDVARLASVSVGTASKALNNNGSLRDETRERVIAAARELGFRPNDLAHSLHRGQSLGRTPATLIGLRDRDVARSELDRHLDCVGEECVADRHAGELLADCKPAPEHFDP